MCDPVSIGLSLTAAQGAAAAYQQGKSFSTQKKAASSIAHAAEESAIRQYGALQARQEQENAKAAQSIQHVAEQARKVAATATVQAGESGVGGNSVAALHADFERSALNYESAVTRNKAMLDEQFKRDADGIQRNQQSQINDAYSRIQPPNYLGILIGSAADALKIKSSADSLKPPGSPVSSSAAGTTSSSILYPEYD